MTDRQPTPEEQEAIEKMKYEIMTSPQVTKEQSARLIELGVPTTEASERAFEGTG